MLWASTATSGPCQIVESHTGRLQGITEGIGHLGLYPSTFNQAMMGSLRPPPHLNKHRRFENCVALFALFIDETISPRGWYDIS